MSYTSKQAAQESQQVATSANKVVLPQFSDQRASTSMQLKQQQMMNASDANPLQRAEDEELLQGKFATVQRAEEEKLLQGKFETAQRAEEEELLQGKFVTTQLADLEEEPLQGKFETTQLVEEEELLQGKFNALQRVEDEELLQGKFNAQMPAQLQEKHNNTGLPNQLKSGIESLSGMSMDGVKVHYNSDKPAQLNAHAYAQGTDIHVAPGQEQHLPHEAWHVVQQAQGRVKPTMQMKSGVPVNDDAGLEHEADVMGAKALQEASSPKAGVAVQMFSAITQFNLVTKSSAHGEKVDRGAKAVRAEVTATIGRGSRGEILDDIAKLNTSIQSRTAEQQDSTPGTDTYKSHTARIAMETTQRDRLQTTYDNLPAPVARAPKPRAPKKEDPKPSFVSKNPYDLLK